MRSSQPAVARHVCSSARTLLVGVLIGLMLGSVGIARDAEANPIQLFDGENFVGRSPKNATASPAHQYTYSGVVFDNGGEPLAGMPPTQIVLRFNAPCQNQVALHPDGPSNSNGVVVWGPETLNQGGGACTGSYAMTIEIDEGGGGGMVVWMVSSVSSPDADGDGLVALSDLVVWQQAFVQQSPLHEGDLDLDGAISLSDLSRWQQHLVAP